MPRKIKLEHRALSWISNNNLSYLMVGIANFFWVTGFIYGNEHNMSFIESQLSRYIMQALITYSICKYMNFQLQFRSALEFSVLFIRSFIFTVHSFILCWSQVYLPLYIVHTISAFGPIFVCMLNFFIYGKVIVKQQILGMCVAFTGILLTVNGRSILAFLDPDYHFSSDFKNYKSDDPFVLLIVALILLLFVVFWAYAILITKKNEHHIVEVVYHQAIFGVIGTSFGYMFLPTKVPMAVFAQSFIYIGLILGGGFTVFNIGLSLSQNTGVCSMITQMTVIIGYGYSVFRYGEKLNIICVLGTILLVSGVFMVIFKKVEPKKEALQSKQSIQQEENLKKVAKIGQ